MSRCGKKSSRGKSQSPKNDSKTPITHEASSRKPLPLCPPPPQPQLIRFLGNQPDPNFVPRLYPPQLVQAPPAPPLIPPTSTTNTDKTLYSNVTNAKGIL